MTAGTDSGSFIGSRWSASTGLTADYKLNPFVLEPSAGVFVAWEQDRAFIDSLGNAIDANNFSGGRASFGAKVARPFATSSSGWVILPYAGLYGDWLFSSNNNNNALPVALPVAVINDGWSGRVIAGLSAMAAPGIKVSLDGELGGLGASYKVWMGNLRATMLF